MLPFMQRTLVIAGALCAILAGAPAAAQNRTPEQEVLAFMIAQYGRGAVLSDSAWGVPCDRFLDGCRRNRGVPRDAWAEYVRVTREPSLLRHVLPQDLDVTFESEQVDDPSIPCRERKNKLMLSRPGISANGRSAVIWWGELVRMDHLGTCGASRGGILLLHRNRAGAWQVDRSLRMFIS